MTHKDYTDDDGSRRRKKSGASSKKSRSSHRSPNPEYIRINDELLVQHQQSISRSTGSLDRLSSDGAHSESSSSSRRHRHRHHREHGHRSGSSEKQRKKRSSKSETYDRPQSAGSSKSRKPKEGLYENLSFGGDENLYDVPKNGNKRVEAWIPEQCTDNVIETEAIYMNGNFDGDEQDFYDIPPKPRSANGDGILGTIKEEEAERAGHSTESTAHDDKNIYANEGFNSDRGSSGYRSSPSEELYRTNSSPELKESRLLEEQKIRELRREEEREKSRAIERQILKKKKSFFGSPQEDSKVIDRAEEDTSSGKYSEEDEEDSFGELPKGSVAIYSSSIRTTALYEEEKEEDDADNHRDFIEEEETAASVDFEEFDIESTPIRKLSSRLKSEKNRSVDVYNETVRQRSAKQFVSIIREEDEEPSEIVPTSEDCDESCSVSRLRSVFEDRRMGGSSSRSIEDGRPVNSAAKVFNPTKFRSNLKNGKFRVMASLTRRSAVSISKKLSPNEFSKTNEPLSLKKMFIKTPWDPIPLIKELYALPIEGTSIDDESPGYGCKGWLDRLPAGKKKATVWSSWKTQYAVLSHGVLKLWADDSITNAPLEEYQLFGGKLERLEDNLLCITDRRSKIILIRISNESRIEEWKNRLDYHRHKDYSSTFVTPITPSPSLLTNILVVDFGSSSVRAGIATKIPSLPTLFFPNVMAIAAENQREKYFGFDAFESEVRSRCELFSPVHTGIDQVGFQGIFESIFKELGVDPADLQIQLSVPQSFPDNTKIALSSILFEEFGVQSLFMGHQSVFSLWAYRSKTGVVVDIGERMDVVPIVDGYKVTSGVSKSPVGGKQLREKAKVLLTTSNDRPMTSALDDFVLRFALEQTAYVARHFDKELDKARDKPESIRRTVTGPEKKSLILLSERFEAPEGLFKPELWGLDQAGIHVLVHKAVRECPMDVRKEVTRSIYCSGGLTSIPGFAERLESELERLSPNVKPKVHVSPYSYHGAYLGASAHASDGAYDAVKMTREQWHGSQGNVLARNWTL